MRAFILIVLVIIISISACKDNPKNTTPVNTSTEDISLLDTLTLRLNNGEKWVANNETQIGILKMDSIIRAFKSNGNENYLSLGENLSKQTSYIIKSCNMTGDAHDQLHVVLVPMLDEISILKDSDNKEESESALNELEDLIEGYFSHFQVN